MDSASRLQTVTFIQIPHDFSFSHNAFKFDASIPFPVQKKDGEDSIDLANLSEEQVLSGMLTVLAYDHENPNLEYYRSVIKQVRPSLVKELGEAAILKTKDEDWDLAEEIYLALHGLDPENMAVTLNMAIFFDQRADSYRNNSLFEDADAYDDIALRYYKECMEHKSELPDAFFNAGFFYLKQRNFSEAKSCFESYLALTSDLKDDELGDNGIYKRERAQEIIDKISNRNLEDGHYALAYKLISSGQEEKGLEEIRKFISANPAVWNAWFLLGWGLRRLNRFEEAKQAFLKAQECEGDDENADTLNELAICQMETGELDKARETLYEALKIDTENTKIISNLGCLELKLGNRDEAVRFFNTVLAIDPEDKIAKAQLDSLK